MAIPIAYRISTSGAQLCVNTRMNIVGLVLVVTPLVSHCTIFAKTLHTHHVYVIVYEI